MVNTFRNFRFGWLAVAALALAAGGPLDPRVLDAQGPPDLEALHQRLLPVFEVAGVVFTDADETRGRVVVGVLDRGVEGLVRATAARLGVAAQDVEIVRTEPIFQVATLRDYYPPCRCRRADPLLGVCLQPGVQRHPQRRLGVCHGVSLQRSAGHC